MAKAKTKNIFRTIISIIYLIYGAVTVIRNIGGLLGNLANISALLTVAMGVIMFVAGFIALFGGNYKLCRIFGVIIFIVAAVSLVLAVVGGGVLSIQSWIWPAIGAVLAWAFIALIK